jgi:cytochrome c-type biogenesis protein CcmH
MTLFIVIAVLLIGVAVLLVSWPVLRAKNTLSEESSNINLQILREQLQSLELELQAGQINQEQFGFQKTEIEKRTVEEVLNAPKTPLKNQAYDKKLAFVFIIGMPLAILGLYFLLGNPAAIEVAQDPQAKQIQEMVTQLEQKLKQDPNNASGWMFLGRSYAVMNRIPEAKMAYQKAIALEPQNADLLADLADLVSFQNKNINAEAMQYIGQALKINPKNVKALALRGSAYFDQKNYPLAIQDWTSAIKGLGPQDQEFARGLQASIEDAKQQIEVAKSDKSTNSGKSVISSSQISGKVSVLAELANQISPEDIVFIYARAENGPRMPVAIMRIKAKELPRDFELNDTQAMSAEMSLSKFTEFTVVARISKSGNAMPQPGDLIGQLEHVKLGTKQLQLVIKSVQP